MAGLNMKVNMSKERDTKNTIRYASDAEDAPVRTLYINKEGLGKSVPEKIQLAITAKED